MKRYRFLIGFPLMIAFIIVGYVLISFEPICNCEKELDKLEFNSSQIKGSKNCN